LGERQAVRDGGKKVGRKKGREFRRIERKTQGARKRKIRARNGWREREGGMGEWNGGMGRVNVGRSKGERV
jgi:hypothetical protein